MKFIAAVLILLAIAVGWLVFRAYTNRSYVKRFGRKGHEIQPDGHIEAEEKIFEAQMKVRLAYFRKVQDHPPEVHMIGETIVCSDDFAAAEPIFVEFQLLFHAHPPERPLGALAVLKGYNYQTVWFLDGLSDIVKAAIYEQSHGKTLFLHEYGVIIARAGDVDGFRRAYFQQPGLNS